MRRRDGESRDQGQPLPKVLIVDDDAAVSRSLARLVRGSFDVRLASSGPEALAILEREAFHLVLTDLEMPAMSGVALLEHVRRRWPETRRLLMSGSHWEGGGAPGSADLVEAFLSKPILARTLLGHLGRRL